MKNNRILEVSIEGGKYTIYQEESGHVWADRYDHEKWLDVTMTPGGKMMLCLAQEIDNLRNPVKLYDPDPFQDYYPGCS